MDLELLQLFVLPLCREMPQNYDVFLRMVRQVKMSSDCFGYSFAIFFNISKSVAKSSSFLTNV